MLLYVIRHGDPNYSPDSLTPLGERQAEAVGRRLARHGLDRIYSSPLVRARQTAKPASEILRLPVEIEDWASEEPAWRDFTQVFPNGTKSWLFRWQNTIFRSDENRFRTTDWSQCSVFEGKDFNEPYKRIIAGSDDFLARQGYVREGNSYRIVRPNDDRVALFCHEGISMLWFPFLLAIPPHLFWASFGITHTGVSIFQFENNEDGWTAPRALAISDISHLYAENLPTSYQNKFRM